MASMQGLADHVRSAKPFRDHADKGVPQCRSVPSSARSLPRIGERSSAGCVSSALAVAARAAALRCLPDGRWFDAAARTWRDRRGRPCRWPDLVEAVALRSTRVVLAAAHLDHNPASNRLRNLRALCQRCHMLHDRPHHLAQRWVTYRRRWALGDFFLGLYRVVPLPRRLDGITAADDPSKGRNMPEDAAGSGL